MNSTASRTRARLLAAALLALPVLAGCGGGEPAPQDVAPPASLSPVAGQDGVQRVTLTEAAVQRLALETAAVTAPAGAAGAAASIPYTAVVYVEDGSTWTYVEDGTRSYVRQPIDVLTVSGGSALLSRGPAVGAKVVVVGAPELLGAEAQISGEE